MAGKVLQKHVSMFYKEAPHKAPIRVRTADTARYNLAEEHSWVMARSGLTDWINNPALNGLGITLPTRTPTQIAASVVIGLGAGFFWGKSRGRKERRTGQKYDFGALSVASVLLGGPLGIGYQVGRYQGFKKK